MSRALETYLVKLYLDRDVRRASLAHPRVELAAASFAGKQVPRGRWARLLAWLRGRP